jgi:hypothetical protein
VHRMRAALAESGARAKGAGLHREHRSGPTPPTPPRQAAIIAYADAALMTAKQEGRDRLITS